METTSLNIYNIDAAILVLYKLIPDAGTLKRWKNSGIKISVFCFDEIHEEKLSQYLEGLTEGIDLLPKNVTKRNKKSTYILKERIKKLQAGLKKTILLADHPSSLTKMKAEGTALSIGLSNNDTAKKAFYDSGADIVLSGIHNIIIKKDEGGSPHFSQSIPGVFEQSESFTDALENKEPVFFFDYDGTLTPIINDPKKASISEKKKKLLEKLSDSNTVAVVSGRDIRDIKSFIGLDSLIYAGSHGFRISGPDGIHMIHGKAVELLPVLDRMEDELVNTLEKEIPGVSIERKHFAIAIHYRNAPPGSFSDINDHADRMIAGNDDFKKGRGKKILEIKPSLDWHKGKAVEWIMNSLDFSFPDKYVPVYIGDDLTDEDAFRTLADDGIGILVGRHSQLSAAHYHLKDVEEVNKFLNYLVDLSGL
ncbi:MAG: trehalose-phosphatase [Bacteroidales bacterium]|nr:trehalose-phosphatase [Bacteroidales bacterium]